MGLLSTTEKEGKYLGNCIFSKNNKLESLSTTYFVTFLSALRLCQCISVLSPCNRLAYYALQSRDTLEHTNVPLASKETYLLD